MTSYWKPRWKNTVLFGSFRELNYRIDIGEGSAPFFSIKTGAGPGFSIELFRHPQSPGFKAEAMRPENAGRQWLDRAWCESSIASLLDVHFSRIKAEPDCMACFCYPGNGDILPEGGQLSWCLELLYELWSAVPPHERQYMRRHEFIE